MALGVLELAAPRRDGDPEALRTEGPGGRPGRGFTMKLYAATRARFGVTATPSLVANSVAGIGRPK